MTKDFSFQVDQYCCRSLKLAAQTRYLKKVTNQVTFCHWGLAVTVEEPLGQAGSSVSSIKVVLSDIRYGDSEGFHIMKIRYFLIL